MPVCSKCGHPLADGDVYCTDCGATEGLPAGRRGPAGSGPPPQGDSGVRAWLDGLGRYPLHALLLRIHRAVAFGFLGVGALSVVSGFLMALVALVSGAKRHAAGIGALAALAPLAIGIGAALVWGFMALRTFYDIESLRVMGDIEANTRRAAEALEARGRSA
jgi:hypothetical protein